MMDAVRTSETSVDNNFTRQFIPEDNSEHQNLAAFLAFFLPASLLGVWAATRAEDFFFDE
jgi:hypothetical protein